MKPKLLNKLVSWPFWLVCTLISPSLTQNLEQLKFSKNKGASSKRQNSGAVKWKNIIFRISFDYKTTGHKIVVWGSMGILYAAMKFLK